MNPYWLEDDLPSRADSHHDGRVDVAIVGAGVTGCSAALRLAESGLRVRVHDRRGIAEGASGRNGGFALRGGAARYDVARETYGADESRALWRWTENGSAAGCSSYRWFPRTSLPPTILISRFTSNISSISDGLYTAILGRPTRSVTSP